MSFQSLLYIKHFFVVDLAVQHVCLMMLMYSLIFLRPSRLAVFFIYRLILWPDQSQIHVAVVLFQSISLC